MSDPRIRMVARLKAITAVTDLVGARIWPMIARQAQAQPYIVYRMVDRVPINHSAGTTTSNYMRIQVDLVASSYDGVMALADAVRGDEAESSPTGLSGWVDADSRVWHLESEQDDMEQIMDGRDQPVAFRIMQDYIV